MSDTKPVALEGYPITQVKCNCQVIKHTENTYIVTANTLSIFTMPNLHMRPSNMVKQATFCLA